MTIRILGTCRACERFLADHPTLRVDRVTEVTPRRERAKIGWEITDRHTTEAGRILHGRAEKGH